MQRLRKDSLTASKIVAGTEESWVELCRRQTVPSQAAWTARPRPHPPSKTELMMRMPMNGGPPTLVLSGKFSYNCAAQASVCVIAEDSKNGRIFSSLDPIKGRGSELARADLSSERYGWSLSADGKTLAALTDSDKSRVQIVRIGGRGGDALKLDGWVLQGVSWSPDNLHLYVSGYSVDSSYILLVGLDGSFRVLLRNSYGWLAFATPSPDGRHLAYLLRIYESHVAMLENY
jgi:hypothetical protein